MTEGENGMSRKNGRAKKPFELETLKPSTEDTIHLGMAVEERFIRLCSAHLRLRGVELWPPKSVLPDMIRWRHMMVRHRNGDFRNTRTELLCTRSMAGWTFLVNCDLRNQTYTPLKWKD